MDGKGGSQEPHGAREVTRLHEVDADDDIDPLVDDVLDL
jgi:hypothetical protein